MKAYNIYIHNIVLVILVLMSNRYISNKNVFNLTGGANPRELVLDNSSYQPSGKIRLAESACLSCR